MIVWFANYKNILLIKPFLDPKIYSPCKLLSCTILYNTLYSLETYIYIPI